MIGCVSVSEAARIKNVTRQAIYLAIQLNRLKAHKFGDRWKIFLSDLKDYDDKRFSRVYHSTIDGVPVFDESKGYYSVEKASQLINVARQKLYYAIRTGALKATRKNCAWVIHVSDLLEYKSELSKMQCTKKRA